MEPETKNPEGRPPLFKSLEDLEEKIEAFWKWIKKNKKHPTMSRLAVFLECDRKTIVNYSHKDEFFHTIKKVRALIEADKNEMLFDRTIPTAGVIFDLVNNTEDWKNPQHHKHAGDKDDETPIPFSLKRLLEAADQSQNAGS